MLNQVPDTYILVLVAAVIGALFSHWLMSRIGALRRSWRAKHRSRIAIRGEQSAIGLLQSEGYAVLATQCPLTWSIDVDGVPIPIELRADAIVERDGLRYVAEIKTGNEAPHIETAHTRRQLLEYLVAYQTDGALLVNVPQHRIEAITFWPNPPADKPRFWQRLCWTCLTLLLLALLLKALWPI